MQVLKYRNGYVDALKGFLMLLVIYFHAYQSIAFETCKDTFGLMVAPFRMPMFFAISGFLVAGACADSWPQLSHSLRKKSMRLLLPTVAWISLHYTLRVLCGLAPFSLRDWLVDWSLDYDFWFLKDLFVILAVHELVTYLLRRFQRIARNVMMILFGIIMAFVFAKIPHHWKMDRIMYYYVFFEVGCSVALIKQDFVKKYGFAIAGILGLAIYTAAFVILKDGYDKANMFVHWVYCIGGMLIAADLVYMMILKSKRIYAVLEKIGRDSLAYYAVHWKVLYVALYQYAFWHFHFNLSSMLKINPHLLTLVMCILWTVVTYLMIKVLHYNKYLSVVFLGDKLHAK